MENLKARVIYYALSFRIADTLLFDFVVTLRLQRDLKIGGGKKFF